MKNIIKIVGYTYLLLILTGCTKKEPLLFFGAELKPNEPSKFIGHDANWLAVSGLNEIYHVRIPAKKLAHSIRMSLGKILPEGYLVNEVVTAFIYTTNKDTSQVNITFEKVHAIGLVRQQGTDFYLDYVEKQKDRFVVLPEFSGNINAGIDMDDIRLFHFASSPGTGLPLVSTIFEFRMDPLRPFTLKGNRNKSIGDAVLMSMNHNKGMNTLDIYGENFYTAMRIDDNNGGSFCGGNGHCPVGSSSCGEPPAGPGMVCGGVPPDGGGGGCVSAVLTHAIKTLNSDEPPFDVVNLYDFKDSFLMKYPKGRQFVSHMYLTGRYMRMDAEALNNYLELMKVGEKAIQKIKGNDDTAVIIDAEFVDVFSTFIHNHKNTKSRKLSIALSILETDLNHLKGISRVQFMNYMKESPINSKLQL